MALRSAGRAVIDASEVEAASHFEPRPGAVELLRRLSDRGVALGLVTNNGRECAERCLAQLPAAWCDDAIVSRDDVERWKPAPDGLIRAATAVLPDGGSLWFVGDSDADIEAARSARLQLSAIEICAVRVGDGDGDVVVAALTELAARLPH